jgi:gamma-glutamyltranspeptidase/glutathione hydrolase
MRRPSPAAPAVPPAPRARWRPWLAALAVSLAAACTAPGAGTPEPPLGPGVQPMAAPAPAPIARGPLVAAAHPLAVAAGMEVLNRGGSAVDAAVAVQAVLGLVEPQSSGLGGGAFMMHYDAATAEVTAYDGRETAPAAAGAGLFLEDGRPLGYADAVLSGRSTGAPGVVAMLQLAQAEHGRLPWSTLFAPAERLATDGFTITPRLAGFIASRAPQMTTPDARAYFTGPDGALLEAGDALRNPAYAETLRRIAQDGADAFRRGPLAEAIVASVGREPRPGALTLADLEAYRPVERGALCRPYRVYVVCVPPPPSSGVAVLQLLAMAERTPAILGGPQDPDAWTAFAQLQRLMYADRDRYVGDPAFVGVPVQGLLDPDYVAARAALAPGLTGAAEPGAPPGGRFTAADRTQEPAGTSHFVIVDAAGNAVSMTTTVESIFGSGRMAGGMFLNNQLTDFSRSGEGANAPAGGKRPRSSMSPVIILDREGRFIGALGSPGGTSILAYNARALIAVLDWGLPVQAAFDLPNLVARGDGFGADTGRFSPALREALAARGITLAPNASETSGLHGAIWRDGWDAGADDRREGVVAGVVGGG